MRPYLISVFVGTVLVTPPVCADIYKYTAPDGRVYYTDEPTHSAYKLIIKSSPRTKKSKPSKSLSLTRILANKKKYSPIIEKAAKKFDLDVNLLHAVIRAESAYNASAKSSVGAIGLMQLMPATAKRYGVNNPQDPEQNVLGGARYLKYLLGLFKSDTRLALAAYNAGEGTVKKYKNTVPPYPETQNYVKKVMRLLQS